MKVLLALSALMAVASAQTGFQFSSGYLDVLGSEPSQSFSCEGRSYGYYADVANDCQIFHVCLPIEDDAGSIIQTAQYSFFCGNQTVFSQDSLSCSHPEDAYPCDQAEGYYDIVNAEFGKIPDGSGRQNVPEPRRAPAPAPAPVAPAPVAPVVPEAPAEAPVELQVDVAAGRSLDDQSPDY